MLQWRKRKFIEVVKHLLRQFQGIFEKKKYEREMKKKIIKIKKKLLEKLKLPYGFANASSIRSAADKINMNFSKGKSI